MTSYQDDPALLRRAQQAAIFQLLKSGIPTAGTATAFRVLTESAAEALGVRRVSIWLFDERHDVLELADLFDLESGRHTSGVQLRAARYPAYFHALNWNRAIVAPDAAADPRVHEFAEGYLLRHGIVSMLDAGIWHGGKACGVVCIESVDSRRDWSADEQQFAATIADIAATALVHDQLSHARARQSQSETLYARAVGASADWISIVRLSDGRILHVNEGFERFSGHRAADVVGRTTLEIGLWADAGQRQEWVRRVLAERAVRDFEVTFCTAAGERRAFSLSGDQVEMFGDPCVLTVSRDVTDRKRNEQLVASIAQGVAAETGDSFFRLLVDHLAQALDADVAFVGELIPSPAGTVRTVAVQSAGREASDFEYRLAGSPCESVINRGSCSYARGVAGLFPDDPGLAEKGIEAYVGAPLNDSSGRVLGLIAVMFHRPLESLTLPEGLLRIFAARASAELERRRQLKELEHLAHHDTLTSLPNRVLLKSRIDGSLEAHLGGEGAALLLVDLDRFKEINDTLGHHVGDVLLRELAARLEREMCRAEVARLGGDEFAIWLAPATRAEAHAAAARVLAALTTPFEIEGYRLELGASVGIAMAPDDATTSAGLLRCADVAMYAAKNHSRGCLAYDPALDPYTGERLRLMSDLAAAVRAGELTLHYQPRVGLADDSLLGFEALVRWPHPTLGLLPPSRFVPLAEISDTIRPLTWWVLGQALAQQRAWTLAGHRTRIAVNLSARHLVDEACPDQVAALVKAAQVDPACLELEITESALIQDPERAMATLERIRAHGVQLAIDDFGTGYSSLSHLKRLPLHALKIDVSFVSHMLVNHADRVIVQSTIGLAHSLGLTVVAEGIEDEATLGALRALGCDEGQGYFVGRPMDAAAATQWLATSRERWRAPARGAIPA